MQSSHSDQLRKEGILLVTLFGVLLIGLWIGFFREGVFTVLRMALSLYWLFVLPGYALLFFLHARIGFLERAIAGSLLSAGLLGILSYYLGLLGLHIKTHFALLPIALIAIGVGLYYFQQRMNKTTPIPENPSN